MTPSQAAQEKPTSPHTHKVNAGCFPSCPAHYSREAAVATPSLDGDRERLRIAIKSELGCYMPEQNDDCDHGVIAARVLARLDEGSATPREQSDD